MRWSDSTHGERLKNAKIGLDPAKKSADAIRGYLWGHFCRLAAQPIDLYDNVIVAASPINETPTVLGWVFSCLIAPVPTCSWGFLRKPADYAGQPSRIVSLHVVYEP